MILLVRTLLVFAGLVGICYGVALFRVECSSALVEDVMSRDGIHGVKCAMLACCLICIAASRFVTRRP
jgi:hypothetical protein